MGFRSPGAPGRPSPRCSTVATAWSAVEAAGRVIPSRDEPVGVGGGLTAQGWTLRIARVGMSFLAEVVPMTVARAFPGQAACRCMKAAAAPTSGAAPGPAAGRSPRWTLCLAAAPVRPPAPAPVYAVAVRPGPRRPGAATPPPPPPG